MDVSAARELPGGLRWATGGGSTIGGCNGIHVAQENKSGTLCGLYGPATPKPEAGTKICGNCSRIAHMSRVVAAPTRPGRP